MTNCPARNDIMTAWRTRPVCTMARLGRGIGPVGCEGLENSESCLLAPVCRVLGTIVATLGSQVPTTADVGRETTLMISNLPNGRTSFSLVTAQDALLEKEVLAAEMVDTRRCP